MTKFGKLALVAGLLLPVTAMAQVNLGDNLGSSEAAIRTALEAQGYAVLEIEREGGEIEVEAILNGQEYEIEISAETGLILEIELEDDSEDS